MEMPHFNPTPMAVRSLGAAILCQMVDDWTTLIRWGNPTGNCNFDEIRNFLSDGWGVDLCDYLGIDSDRILAKLEKDLRDFHNYGILPRRYNLRNDVSKS